MTRTAWSRLDGHLDGFLEDASDPVVGLWARGQGPNAPDRLLLRQTLRHFTREDSSLTFLEFGCGAGVELQGLLNSDLAGKVSYRGLDFTPEMVATCRRRFPNHDFEIRDVTRPGVGDQAEFVLARHVLEHVPDWRSAMGTVWTASTRVAVISWFMRPSQEPTEVRHWVTAGFHHQVLSLMSAAQHLRALGVRHLYRFDFANAGSACSVWLMARSSLAQGVLEDLHAFTLSGEFLNACYPAQARGLARRFRDRARLAAQMLSRR
jgi:SAM-dependent methyltransferase